ncbi:serine/threonine protein kinase [Aspergillus heteromorphus CBS 117.55]|uniref:Serine/threonine protein kinase n=1 Tax=Aspergillus heteromorphus CBS 117.55 TaxID=1448321 RepID=A0A317V057_9EURO|nr:serine/threonine protein kinase [Aspergillus heteromorphus CBS 117.55]PWY66751.1 serine/threonine protein kinase [Aspergillus heteromorphus CBS 117.55]
MRDERAVHRLLEKHPHPNIVEALDTTRPEGIYFRKYHSCPDPAFTAQGRRIRWYQDIIRGLAHIHSLGITHSDLHRANILLDNKGNAVLSDFGGSCRQGASNPFIGTPQNGYTETVCDASDRFAMGSLIYEMEKGYPPQIRTNSETGDLLLPRFYTGHDGIDLLIDHAWRGEYTSTREMLARAEELYTTLGREEVRNVVPKKKLRARIKQWRKVCEREHGCILYSLPTEVELHDLEERYGQRMKEEGLRD